MSSSKVLPEYRVYQLSSFWGGEFVGFFCLVQRVCGDSQILVICLPFPYFFKIGGRCWVEKEIFAKHRPIKSHPCTITFFFSCLKRMPGNQHLRKNRVGKNSVKEVEFNSWSNVSYRICERATASPFLANLSANESFPD